LVCLFFFPGMDPRRKETTAVHLRICFTADLHGNLSHYEKLITIAEEKQCDVIIVGGDLMPKNQWTCVTTGIERGEPKKVTRKERGEKVVVKSPLNQRRFFQEEIVPFFMRTKIPSYFIMGNADYKCNIEYFKELSKENNYHFTFLDGRGESVPLFPSSYLILVGYIYVPLSTKRLKDWEKLDTNDWENYYPRSFVIEGQISTAEFQVEKIEISLSNPPDSVKLSTMENDIEALCASVLPQLRQQREATHVEGQEEKEKETNGERRIIWCFHDPPYDTNLDVVHSGRHVGSRAIRNAIEKHKPYITFHGHIHETVQRSGHFCTTLNDKQTYCFSAGERCNRKELACLVVDTQSPEEAQRFVI